MNVFEKFWTLLQNEQRVIVLAPSRDEIRGATV